MASLNDTLRVYQLRHMVGIQRLSTSVLQKLIPILNAAEQDIVDQITARELTPDQGRVVTARLEALLQAVRQTNLEASIAIGGDLSGYLQDVAGYESQYQSDLMAQVLPVQMDLIQPTAETLQAVVTDQPFADGQLLSEWVSSMEARNYQRLMGAIRMGIIEGQSTGDIVAAIRGTAALGYRDGIMEGTRRGLEALVRTSTNHVSNAARDLFFNENDDLIDRVQWVATLDTRTCFECMALDGETFAVDEGPRPPAHINCRCTMAPVTKSWRDLGLNLDEITGTTRASMDGQVSDTQTFNEWLRGQPADVQDEALGPTRGALFRSGGLSVDRFVNLAGDELTLEQLAQKEQTVFRLAGVEP